MKETPNRVEPFYKVVEGLKISLKPVGVKAQKLKGNRVEIGSKIMLQKEIWRLTLEDPIVATSWPEFVAS